MISFILGVVVGALGLFLILDNNPKLTGRLSAVKKIVKKEIEDKVKGL